MSEKEGYFFGGCTEIMVDKSEKAVRVYAIACLDNPNYGLILVGLITAGRISFEDWDSGTD